MSLTNSPFWFSSGATAAGGGAFYPYSIDQSLRFNDNDSAYLNRTPSSAGNRKTWTWSGWVKRGNLSSYMQLFDASSSSTDQARISFTTANAVQVDDYNGSFQLRLTTSALLRDTSSWYNIVVSVDTTQATSSDRASVYINGVKQTSFSNEIYPSLNYDTNFNNTVAHNIGRRVYNNDFFLDGYMAEVNFIDGTALDATSFGETINGVWVPKAYSGSYGTNGFYLDFSDNSTASALGTDSSGNGNNFSVNNLATTDKVLDSPTNNFATLNPLANFASVTFADGNLYHNASGNNKGMLANWVLPKSGKWYWEHYSIQFHYPTDNEAHFVGINTPNVSLTSNRGGLATAITVSSQSGPYDGSSWVLNVRNGSYGSTGWDENEGVGVVYDADAQTIAWKVNGGTTTTPISVPDGDWIPWVGTGGSTGSEQGVFNFGQDGTFGGRTTSGNYTDANGNGNFKWEPPTDALALCTASLPEPAIGQNSDTTNDENFNTVLYTGDGTSGQAITGVGHSPDFVWIKKRSATGNHQLFDTIRGATYRLNSNTTNAEASFANVLQSFDSDGFTVGGDGDTGGSGQTYVGWSWKAGGTAVSNTSGSITSSVSANQDAGFSIVTYASTTGTVGHGLTQAPEAIIMKATNVSDQWTIGHKDLNGGSSPWNYGIPLNSTVSIQTNSGFWNNTAPTSTVFSQGSWDSGYNKVAYCFHSVEGFSKVGNYVGNANADGPFVYTGFRPAFVLLKVSSASNYWFIYDNKREGYNQENDTLSPNVTDSEDNSYKLDLVSNGFKIRGSNNAHNQSGQTFIYLAFAENPFKYANAR